MYAPIGVGISCVLAIAIVSGICVCIVKRRRAPTTTVEQEDKGNEMLVLEECDDHAIDEMLPKII